MDGGKAHYSLAISDHASEEEITWNPSWGIFNLRTVTVSQLWGIMTSNILTEVILFIWVCHWAADVQDPLWDTATICYSQILSDLEKKFIILFFKSHSCCPSTDWTLKRSSTAPAIKSSGFNYKKQNSIKSYISVYSTVCISLTTGSLCTKHFKRLDTFFTFKWPLWSELNLWTAESVPQQ